MAASQCCSCLVTQVGQRVKVGILAGDTSDRGRQLQLDNALVVGTVGDDSMVATVFVRCWIYIMGFFCIFKYNSCKSDFFISFGFAFNLFKINLVIINPLIDLFLKI